jgi:hypothetical protein
VGRRGRRRAAAGVRADGGDSTKLKAPESEYVDADGNALVLRGSLTAAARREHADTLAGRGVGATGGAAATREDAWQRAAEMLFERLAVRWTIAGAPIDGQRQLLARYRAASQAERAWIRSVLREHCAEWFPDVEAP